MPYEKYHMAVLALELDKGGNEQGILMKAFRKGKAQQKRT